MRIFSKIDERNARQVKNIFLSFFFRGIMVISSFITIPLCLNFLSKSEYGAWLTIYSILGWIGFFDLGLGNGLKNKISEAIAKNDVNLIKKIISTNYIVMLIIIVIVISIFLISGLYIDWSELINLKSKEVHYNKIITICFISFCFKLFLDSLNGILSAYQKPFYIVLIASMSSILSLISIYFLSKFKIPSSQQIAGLAYIVSIIPVIISLGYSIYLFGTTFKEIRPEIKYFDRQIVKSLFSLGGEFFIIQVAGLIIFSSDTLLVAKLFDTEQVTNFNISIRLFSAFNVVWGVIISPYWVAFNESYVKQDYAWIKKTIKMLLLLWSILSVLVLVTLIFVNNIYRLWIGEETQIPYIISINVGIYMLLLTYSNIFAYFINGVGKIRLQLYTSIVAAIINIPFSIYLVNVWGMGVEGIILSTSVSISIGAIFGTIQYKKIVAKNAYGIWNK